MKTKNKPVSQPQNRLESWKRILPRLAAIILLIVFLASECAALIPEY